MSDWPAILRAARDMLIFAAFVAILLTAPVWGELIDGTSDRWEMDAAQRHAEVYERVSK